MAIELAGMVNDPGVPEGTLQIGHTSGNDGTVADGNVGAGSFTVNDGTTNTLEASNSPFQPTISIARNTGSIGFGLITGAGSTLNLLVGPGAAVPPEGTTVNIGREGGQGWLTIAYGGKLGMFCTDDDAGNSLSVGRGTDEENNNKRGEGFLRVTDGSMELDGPGSVFRVGRNGGLGHALIENGSDIKITATAGPKANTLSGLALLSIGAQHDTTDASGQVIPADAESNGTLIASDSTITVKGSGEGALARLLVASENPEFSTSPTNLVGRLLLTDGTVVAVEADRAFARFGTAAGARAEVTVASGSSITVTDTDDTNGRASIEIGMGLGVLQASVTVTGINSRLEATSGSIRVGREVASGGTGNGVLTVSDGGSLVAGKVMILRGGTIIASDASIEADIGIDTGTLRLGTGGPVSLSGSLVASGGATLRFEVARDAGGGLLNGSLDQFGGNGAGVLFADAKIAIDSIDGTKFATGQTLTLGTSDSGFFFSPGQMSAADVSVTGQAAGFGFLLSNANSNLTFKALNNGAAPGVAVLDFGSADLSGSVFTYDTFSRSGRGSGGVLGDVLAREVDEVNGTAANDVFTIVGNSGLVLRGFGGNDTLLGALGADTLEGGTGIDLLIGGRGLDKLRGGAGNDKFLYTGRTDSNPGSTADRILDFDDAGDDKIDLAAVYAKTLSYIGAAKFTKTGQVRINDIKGADLLVEVNLDTDSAAEMQIRLVGTTLASMSKGDFIL
jgi:hypothetical protein